MNIILYMLAIIGFQYSLSFDVNVQVLVDAFVLQTCCQGTRAGKYPAILLMQSMQEWSSWKLIYFCGVFLTPAAKLSALLP